VSSAGRPLADRLGVPDIDGRLLQRALTHRSWSAEHRGDPHNERLELLGDAVIDLVVTAELHGLDEDADEGVLSRRRAQLVRESTLAAVAREVGLGAELRLGRGETASGGADKDSLLADALEAVIGAVFLTDGYASAAAVVIRLLGTRLEVGVTVGDRVDRGAGPVDAKTALQERLAAQQRPAPEYRTTKEGPDHAPVFVAEALVDGDVIGSGSGGSKKAASQAAAEQALRREPLG
jgi:ribonuclease-3